MKKSHISGSLSGNYAEREGFEPPNLLQLTVFKTAAFDHSAISPRAKLDKQTDIKKVFFNYAIYFLVQSLLTCFC